MHEITEKLKEILKIVQKEMELHELSYKTWLLSLKVKEVRGKYLIFETSLEGSCNEFIQWKFGRELANAIEKLTGERYTVVIISKENSDE